MAVYKEKSPRVEAYSFDEFVEYGRKNTNNIVNNMPWSFGFFGRNVSHENDKCYRISNAEGDTITFRSNEVILAENGSYSVLSAEEFNSLYEKE